MAEEFLLSDDFLRQLMDVGQVDLIVAIPASENAAAMGHTISATEESFRRGFPRDRVVILTLADESPDASSRTATTAVLENNGKAPGITSLRTINRISTRSSGSSSPGSAVRTILAAADLLQAKACALVSPQTTSLDPTWIKNLLQPAYRDGFDLVSPLYCRPKFDGLLARNVLYPMSRAVLGQGIRELYPTELGFSGKFASECLKQDVWREEAVKKTPFIWMAVSAIASHGKCCQTFLGTKERSTAASGADIVSIVSDAVGAMFWCLETNQDFWKKGSISSPITTLGSPCQIAGEGASIDRSRIFDLFTKGVAELSPILKSILSSETQAEIERIAHLDKEQSRIGNRLWARILFEFAASYHHAVMNRAHLIQSLVPLYRGRIYSFLADHENSSDQQIEADTEDLCLAFERQKPYLIEKWNQR